MGSFFLRDPQKVSEKIGNNFSLFRMLDYTLVYLSENLIYETKNDFMVANQAIFVMKTATSKRLATLLDYQQFFLFSHTLLRKQTCSLPTNLMLPM